MSYVTCHDFFPRSAKRPKQRRRRKPTKPPQIGQSAFVVIDTDGRVCWSFCHENKKVASVWAESPGRKVARVEVVEIVEKSKSRKPKESKR